MPEEAERTRVDRLLLETGKEIETIKTAIGNLSFHPPREQIEELIVMLETILEKVRQAGLDHKAYYQEAYKLRGKHEDIISRLKAGLEILTAELKEYKPIVDENEKLRHALQQTRDQVLALKEEIDKLSAPPRSFGLVHQINGDGTVDIYTGSRKLQVNLHPAIDQKSLKGGMEVILNDAFNIIMLGSTESQGEVVTLEELMEDGIRAKVNTRLDESRIVELAEPLRALPLKVGDLLLFDPRSGYCVERLPKSEVQDLLLAEAPDITYDRVGGLRKQIEELRSAIELPFLHPDYFKHFQLEAPKGILLYGPPGCGKTLIAKAIANNLGQRLREKLSRADIKGYFINIKGPEILSKWVGESERKIREIFQRAREKAKADCPVIIFLDEADSVLRTRGAGISSDVEMTIVPQFLVELDGLEALQNVLVVFASNRQDLIDPAVLRPGRVDIKIRVDRPDKDGAKEIFGIYLTPDIPLHSKYTNEKNERFKPEYKNLKGDPKLIIQYIIDTAIRRLWANHEEPYHYKDAEGITIEADNRILEVIPRDGPKFTICLKDLVSGAMIKSIVDRAKRLAIERAVAGGEYGLQTIDFCIAIEKEMRENEELPNTSADAELWLRMQGRREQVAGVRPLDHSSDKKVRKRRVETVTTGQYL